MPSRPTYQRNPPVVLALRQQASEPAQQELVNQVSAGFRIIDSTEALAAARRRATRFHVSEEDLLILALAQVQRGDGEL